MSQNDPCCEHRFEAEQLVTHNGRPFLTIQLVPRGQDTAAHNGRTFGLIGMHVPSPFTTTHIEPTKHNVAAHGLSRTKEHKYLVQIIYIVKSVDNPPPPPPSQNQRQLYSSKMFT